MFLNGLVEESESVISFFLYWNTILYELQNKSNKQLGGSQVEWKKSKFLI